MSIGQRKKDHVSLSASGQAAYMKTAGFERFDFIHNALPEIDLDQVDPTVEFLGYTADAPLFISSMTGGYTEAGQVNRIIAAFCQTYKLPFGVGSQRIMLEEPESASSFTVVREEAPDAFIAANIGGCQLEQALLKGQIYHLIESIEANAVIVHLNVLQELMQTEGDRGFRGIRNAINELVQQTDLPVIVKETGAGINGNIARKLIDSGVSVVDVSGSGGTSWSKIENRRRQLENHPFDEWGNPTVDCITEARQAGLTKGQIIASGGVRSAVEIGKALCLGAGFTAMAQPVIREINNGGYDALETWYKELRHQITIMMCLLGCTRVNELSESHLRTLK